MYVKYTDGSDVRTVGVPGTKTISADFTKPVNKIYFVDQDWQNLNVRPYTLNFDELFLKKKIVLSDDATLSALTVNQGTLTPAFDPATTSYTVEVSNIASIVIQATANHPEASVAGTGAQTLVYGENPFAVTVTAENGAQKIYNVTVTAGISLDLLEEITQLKADTAALAEANRALQSQLTVSNNTISDMEGLLGAANNTISDMEGLLSAANNTISDLQELLSAANNTIDDMQGQIEDLESQLTACLNTSISSISAGSLQLFPNPATDYITISGLQANETIRIYDISGTLLLNMEVAQATENIAIGHLSAGMYFVKAGNKVMKMMKN